MSFPCFKPYPAVFFICAVPHITPVVRWFSCARWNIESSYLCATHASTALRVLHSESRQFLPMPMCCSSHTSSHSRRIHGQNRITCSLTQCCFCIPPSLIVQTLALVAPPHLRIIDIWVDCMPFQLPSTGVLGCWTCCHTHTQLALTHIAHPLSICMLS